MRAGAEAGAAHGADPLAPPDRLPPAPTAKLLRWAYVVSRPPAWPMTMTMAPSARWPAIGDDAVARREDRPPDAAGDVDAVMEVGAAAARRVHGERGAAVVAADRARRGPSEYAVAVDGTGAAEPCGRRPLGRPHEAGDPIPEGRLRRSSSDGGCRCASRSDWTSWSYRACWASLICSVFRSSSFEPLERLAQLLAARLDLLAGLDRRAAQLVGAQPGRRRDEAQGVEGLLVLGDVLRPSARPGRHRRGRRSPGS